MVEAATVSNPFPGWDGSIAGARALQAQLAARVRLEDDFHGPPRTVVGLDVGFEDGGDTVRAAAVLLDATSLHTLEMHVARRPTQMPYVPGLLSFRELPALLAPVQRVTGYDVVMPLPRLEHHYLPSVERIVAAVRKAMEGS